MRNGGFTQDNFKLTDGGNMSHENSSGGNIDRKRLAILMEQFQHASGATTADRTARGQLLDELQEAVGLSGKMVTEVDILRRAEKLLHGR